MLYTGLGLMVARVGPTLAPVFQGRGPALVQASRAAAAVAQHPPPLSQTSPAPLTGDSCIY